MDIANNRGSEWRKWDLHLHSPLSFLKNEYGSNWEGWIENLKERNIKAIGLTNYFRFNVVDSNNEINIVREKLKDIEIVVFPNLEFRLAQPNKDGDFINIHVIFSDKVKTLDIENFLNRLKTKNEKYCSDLKSKSDFEGATINDETLIKQLESDFVRLQDYLIVCCPNGYGGFRQNNREGRSVEVASQYDNLADIFFARQQDTSYFLDEKRFQGAKQKAVIYCSDAHSINDMAIDKFTWIKSDVNFEGLKQVMHEPEQRVAIQTIKPEEKAGYQVIDSVKIIHSDFLPQTLYFNENLNSIIGGRSTGKSILLGIIAKRLNSNHEVKYDNEEYTKYVDEIVSDIQIKWKDGLIDNNRDIEYFPQSYMYSLAKNQKKELDNLVENIIKQDNNKERLINTYKTFSSENNTEITNKINKLFQLIKDINSKRILLKEKGDQKGIETEIDRLTKELLELKSKSHISHAELTQYNAFKSENDSLNKQFQNISDEIFKIEALKSKFFITNEIDFELVALSDSNKELIKSGFTNLKLEFENKWIVKIDSFIELNRKQKEHVETSITAIIENPIYIKGFEEFQNNTHYKGVEEKLKIQKDKLEDIIKIDKEIKDLHEQIDYFKISIKEANRNYINKIEAIKNDLSISNGKLEIKAYPKLNKNKFKDLMNYPEAEPRGIVLLKRDTVLKSV
nr:hypothetical protein [uncultured Flavobacterium sp.]